MHPSRSRSILGSLLILLVMSACGNAQVRGRLVDFRTDDGIANATVTLSQRGWGRSSGGLVWDKEYRATTRTEADGTFQLSLPGPRPLTGGYGSLSIEAPEWQRITEVAVTGGANVLLQTLPTPETTVPGGIARMGVLDDGTPFGWSFVANAPTTNRAEADVFPLVVEKDPARLTLIVPPGGGLRFISEAEQRIAEASYGHLLRYVNEAPPDGYGDTLVLHADTPGTVFVRTPYDRYAKLAFDARRLTTGSGRVSGMEQPVRFAVMLPFAFNPRPGRELPFDPAGSTRSVDPRLNSVLADLPADGTLARIPRTYRITMLNDNGAIADSFVVRLEPETVRNLEGAPRAGSPVFAYRNVRLDYDEGGLPRVRLTVDGEHFTYNSAPMLVGRRRPTAMDVDVYAPHKPVRRFELRLQEVEEP
ncbi:MAG TPA: hypothetical protein VKZ41_07020 [Gemmatimonadales bacterium]|nr:hypothetical protein [Gemmatimonadales bacterium]